MKDKMDLIWGIEQIEKELAKTHSPASNIMSICTEVLKQTEELFDNIIEQHFERCDFKDECDFCHNDDNEWSYAKMSGCDGEVDYYICRSCALKRIRAKDAHGRVSK